LWDSGIRNGFRDHDDRLFSSLKSLCLRIHHLFLLTLHDSLSSLLFLRRGDATKLIPCLEQHLFEKGLCDKCEEQSGPEPLFFVLTPFGWCA
jgi:hypothetical protein